MRPEIAALIEQLDALEAKATKGPWVAEIDYAKGSKRRFINSAMVVAEKGGMPGILVSQGDVEKRDIVNAHLIAALRNSWPKLRAALTSSVEGTDMVRVPRAALKEWHAFWSHYSHVNESDQDDMSNERDEVLAAMQAMLSSAGQDGKG